MSKVFLTFLALILSSQPLIAPLVTKNLPDLNRVEFVSHGVTLVGRIDYPDGDGPFPAVVWVHGSGESTRSEGQNQVSALNNAGIAILRYDKRGVGESGGVYSGVNPFNSVRLLSELAGDALAAVSYLKTLPSINHDQVGLFGASQAGWIIPIAASQTESVDFNVILVGPAVSVGIENYYSDLTSNSSQGLTDERLDELSERLKNFQGYHGFDPKEAIEEMDVPSIWVLGKRDGSIPTRETAAVLEEIKARLEKDFTIHIYPTGTHGLSDWMTGQRLPYMSDIVLPWLEAILGE